jgi:hypothetical protein
VNRREFVALGASCAALFAAQASLAFQPSGAGGMPLLAIADRRYSDSLRFAEGIAGAGGSVMEIGSDIGTLWFGDIEPRLQDSGLRLAGLTLPSDLFVLERLADSSRSTTVYAGCHDWRGPCSQHRLSGAVRLTRALAALRTGALDWPRALGEAIAAETMPKARAEIHHLSVELAAASDNPRYLTSWLMTLA